MIQIDVVHSGTMAQCSYAGQVLTRQSPLAIVRQKQTALRFRFCNVSGTADASVTAAMLSVSQVALTAADRILALTESGMTTSLGDDGCLLVDVAALATDTEAVRTRLADGHTEDGAEGVPCMLEFSAKSSAADTALSLWFAIPVQLFNPVKEINSAADELAAQVSYYTAAETRAAIREAQDELVVPQALTAAAFIPRQDRIYTKTAASGDVFTFAAPANQAMLTFELHLSQGVAAVSFSWGSTVWWMDDDGNFAAGNEAPDFSTASTLYALVFRYDGTRWLGNCTYTQTFGA